MDIESDDEFDVDLPAVLPHYPIEVDEILDEVVSDDPGEDEENQMFDREVDSEEGDELGWEARDGTIWESIPPTETFIPAMVPTNVGIGPTSLVPPNACLLEIFSLFFTDEILDLILCYTNAYGEWMVRYRNDRIPDDPIDWNPVDLIELKAFFRLIYYHGVRHDYRTPFREMWSTDRLKRNPVFIATMTRDRFMLILQTVRFDNAVERYLHIMANGPRSLPKGRPIDEIFEKVVDKFHLFWNPSDRLTTDETLLKFRGRCPFRVYIKSKPGRYGIKLWTCTDDRSYILKAQIYQGKNGNAPERNQGARVVKDMVSNYYTSWRTVTTDNFFTSLPLAKELHENGLMLLGTVRKIRKEIPREFTVKGGRESFSSIFGFHGPATLVSYLPDKKKNLVLCMSTNHHGTCVANQPHQKPVQILDYNISKGGVDCADQCMAMYTCQRGTRRWPLKIFFGLLDMVALNSHLIHLFTNPSWKATRNGKMKGHRRRLAIEELAMQLIENQIRRRSEKRNNRLHVVSAMKDFAASRKIELPFPEPPVMPHLERIRGRIVLPPNRRGRPRFRRHIRRNRAQVNRNAGPRQHVPNSNNQSGLSSSGEASSSRHDGPPSSDVRHGTGNQPPSSGGAPSTNRSGPSSSEVRPSTSNVESVSHRDDQSTNQGSQCINVGRLHPISLSSSRARTGFNVAAGFRRFCTPGSVTTTRFPPRPTIIPAQRPQFPTPRISGCADPTLRPVANNLCEPRRPAFSIPSEPQNRPRPLVTRYSLRGLQRFAWACQRNVEPPFFPCPESTAVPSRNPFRVRNPDVAHREEPMAFQAPHRAGVQVVVGRTNRGTCFECEPPRKQSRTHCDLCGRCVCPEHYRLICKCCNQF